MILHIKQSRQNINLGYHSITSSQEKEDNTGMDFGILTLPAGNTITETIKVETALLHMQGSLTFTVEENLIHNTRNSFFDEQPFCIHAPCNTNISIHAHTNAEIAICSVPNTQSFPYRIYYPHNTKNECRGENQVDNQALRFVRTIFDDRNSSPNSQLVLGEVVNWPGRWSSYPPHHHPQPEIYHYRFSHPHGYGHAELGDNVVKVRQYDTVKILNGVDHAQCSAPGYGMYYIWLIRHLHNQRYKQPEFAEDHKWTMNNNAIFWSPYNQEEVTI